MYTFKKEIEHYAPLVTSEGDLTRKGYRILIPYTPENPDRLIKYAIRVAKENDGEVNVLRVLTVPNQTPLSAGTAFADAARKSFEPLEKMLERENILNHHLFRISHDTSEAILATIEEQKIHLVIIDFETYRNNKKLETLITCDVLAIRTTGDDFVLESSPDQLLDLTQTDLRTELNPKKNMVVLYDGGYSSDVVLKATSWLEHSGKFNVSVLAIHKRLEDQSTGSTKEFEDRVTQDNKRKEYLEQVGVEFNEIYMSDETRKNSEKFADLILSAVNASQPDLVVTGSTILRFSFLSNNHLLSVLNQLNCPVVIAKEFNIPGVHRAKIWFMKLIKR
jgi:nucleotide-binding universal stress UspA family protein